MFDSDGRFVGYRGTGRDITKEVQAGVETAACQGSGGSVSRAKSEFVTTMSHELRTP